MLAPVRSFCSATPRANREAPAVLVRQQLMKNVPGKFLCGPEFCKIPKSILISSSSLSQRTLILSQSTMWWLRLTFSFRAWKNQNPTCPFKAHPTTGIRPVPGSPEEFPRCDKRKCRFLKMIVEIQTV
jgi:hypothetical protein